MFSPKYLLTAGLVASTVSAQAPVQPSEAPSNGEATHFWADFDGDGLLDVFSTAAGRADAMLRNLGDGRFAEVTGETGLAQLFSRSVQAHDFNRDGLVDLLLAGRDGRVQLLENSGGAFEAARGLAQVQGATKASGLDFDGDGWLDIWVESATGGVSLLRNLEGLGFESVDLGLAAPLPSGVAPSSVSSEKERATSAPESGVEADSAPTSDDRRPVAPVEVSLAGGSQNLLAPPTPTSVDLIAGPLCASAIRDTAGSGCMTASSTPTLGSLYPISSNLFVSATGRVGIGTTSPQNRFDVNGISRFRDDMFFAGDNNGIRFPNASGGTSPMISMFVSGDLQRRPHGAGPLGQLAPDRGLEYEDDRGLLQVPAARRQDDPALDDRSHGQRSRHRHLDARWPTCTSVTTSALRSASRPTRTTAVSSITRP